MDVKQRVGSEYEKGKKLRAKQRGGGAGSGLWKIHKSLGNFWENSQELRNF